MNLAEIRDEIENELRWAPAASAHKTDLTRLINRVYSELCTSHRWLFLEAIANFETYEDVEITVTAVTNNHQVTTSPTPGRHWVGHELVGPNGEVSVINYVSGSQIYLEEPLAAGGALLNETCTIRFRSYLLPADCDDILGIMSRTNDRGEIPPVDRAAERELMLNDDETGSPTCYLLDSAPVIRAPYLTPTLAISAGIGTVPAGTYRYAYTFYYAGLESGRSGISAPLTLPLADTINVTNFEQGIVGQGHGYRLYREDDSNGVFRLVFEVGPNTTTYGDTGALAVDQYLNLEEAGPRKMIRFYPRPSEDTTLEVRYHKKPTRLAHDNHVPILPEQFHGILVHMALMELGTRFGDHNFARLHEKRANEKLSLMKRRYLHNSGQTFVRRHYQIQDVAPYSRPKVTLA